jgi:hypothetical protein
LEYPSYSFTIADLFAGKKPQIPFVDASSFRAAPREKTSKQREAALTSLEAFSPLLGAKNLI